MTGLSDMGAHQTIRGLASAWAAWMVRRKPTTLCAWSFLRCRVAISSLEQDGRSRPNAKLESSASRLVFKLDGCLGQVSFVARAKTSVHQENPPSLRVLAGPWRSSSALCRGEFSCEEGAHLLQYPADTRSKWFPALCFVVHYAHKPTANIPINMLRPPDRSSLECGLAEDSKPAASRFPCTNPALAPQSSLP